MIVVALTNLWVGVVCVTFFEVFRRKMPRIFSPKAALCPGTCPGVLHAPGAKPGAPLSWIRPLMRLDEDEILRCGGYDVLIYLRFMSLSLRIFGSFAPYAFLVLLPVNASVSYWPGTDSSDDDGATSSKDNTFNRLSMSAMPMHDKRMWAHCVGCFLLTGPECCAACTVDAANATLVSNPRVPCSFLKIFAIRAVKRRYSGHWSTCLRNC